MLVDRSDIHSIEKDVPVENPQLDQANPAYGMGSVVELSMGFTTACSHSTLLIS